MPLGDAVGKPSANERERESESSPQAAVCSPSPALGRGGTLSDRYLLPFPRARGRWRSRCSRRAAEGLGVRGLLG